MSYKCNRCGAQITFTGDRIPRDLDGAKHKCGSNKPAQPAPVPIQASAFALAAMNGIIAGQLQAGGVDFIHHMNMSDVADAAWRMAGEMMRAERDFRLEFSQS